MSDIPAGRIHNTAITKLDWTDRIRVMFGQSIRVDTRLDWELRDDRLVIVGETADTYVSRLWPQRSSASARYARSLPKEAIGGPA